MTPPPGEDLARDARGGRHRARRGDPPDTTLRGCWGKVPKVEVAEGEVVVWCNGKAEPSSGFRRRNITAGTPAQSTPPAILAEDAFVFRGPEGKLKLRAQNPLHLLEDGGGVDEDTWLHHLAPAKGLLQVVPLRDQGRSRSPRRRSRSRREEGRESRVRIRAAIEKRYTLGE